MAEAEPSGKTVIGLLRRRRVWMVATVAAVVAIADVIALLTPPPFEASALMVIDQRSTSPSTDLNATISTGQLLAAHYIKMATSRTVLDQVCDGAGVSCTADSLKDQVTVSTVKGTDLLAVKVTDASPGRAAMLANLIASAVIDEQHNEVATALKPTKAYLDSELTRLQDEMKTAKPPLLTAVQAQYATVFNRREAVSEQEARLNGSFSSVEAALAPARPAYSRQRLYLLAGLVVGLVAALITALVVDRVDTRILDRTTLSDATGAPLVLAC